MWCKEGQSRWPDIVHRTKDADVASLVRYCALSLGLCCVSKCLCRHAIVCWMPPCTCLLLWQVSTELLAIIKRAWQQVKDSNVYTPSNRTGLRLWSKAAMSSVGIIVASKGSCQYLASAKYLVALQRTLLVCKSSDTWRHWTNSVSAMLVGCAYWCMFC